MYIAVVCFCLAANPAHSADDDVGWLVPKDSAAKNFYLGAGVGRVNTDIADTNQGGSVSNVSIDDTAQNDLFAAS